MTDGLGDFDELPPSYAQRSWPVKHRAVRWRQHYDPSIPNLIRHRPNRLVA